MPEDIFRELEELKRVLEAPHAHAQPSEGPSTNIASPPAPKTDPEDGSWEYAEVVSGAEEGVARLARAIDQADDEVDSALRHTEAVQRLAAQRRQHEIDELRSVIAGKEEAIDALRSELSSTKRALEERARHLQQALEEKSQEGSLVQASLAALNKQHTEALSQNDQLREQLAGIHRQHAHQNKDLQGVLSEAQLALKHLRSEKEELAHGYEQVHQALQCAEARTAAAEADATSLSEVAAVSKGELEEMMATMQVMQKKLRAERKVRKASEKWLRAELKSRGDMEQLFTAVRDMTLTSRMTDEDAERVRCLIDGLRGPASADSESGACKARLVPRGGARDDVRAQRQGRAESAGETDSQVLHTQLLTAKQLLQRRLKGGLPEW